MRVILVAGPSAGAAELPMGVLTLAAVGKAVGVDAELLELPGTERDEEKFLGAVSSADLVGFSTVCSTYPQILLLCERVKNQTPSTMVALGGPQATSTATATLERYPSVDLIIRGEAEPGWETLMTRMRGGASDLDDIPGGVWRRDGEVVSAPLPTLNADLDTLPIPLYEDYLPLQEMPASMVEVGRGCPYGCTFCSTNTFFKRRFRMKSPGRILEEIDLIHRRFGTRHFDFIHDMFTVRRDTVEAICDAMRSRPFSWNCSCRTDRLDDLLLERMRAAGCTGLYVGLETGAQRLQRELKKGLDLREAVSVLRSVRRLGLDLTASLIVGFPQETRADLRDTLLLATELMTGFGDGSGPRLTCQIHLFAPLADTPLARDGWRFAFDGAASNTIELGRRLRPKELSMIAGDFELFSAFYHPVGTEYSRSDYLVLTSFLETRTPESTLWRYVLQRDRVGFVEFLVRGQFDPTFRGKTSDELALAMFRSYAAQSRDGHLFAYLVAFEEAVRQASSAALGWRTTCQVPGACVDLIVSGDRLPPWFRKDHLLPLEVFRSARGVEVLSNL